MSEVLQLNQQTENIFDFTIEIDGLSSLEVHSWLVIKTKGIELSFPCTKNENIFTCKIPPIPFIERTAYDACLRLVVDDMFFEPVSNLVVNVTGNMSFSQNDITNMTLKSSSEEARKLELEKIKKEEKRKKTSLKEQTSGMPKKPEVLEESTKEVSKQVNETELKRILAGIENKNIREKKKRFRFQKNS